MDKTPCPGKDFQVFFVNSEGEQLYISLKHLAK